MSTNIKLNPFQLAGKWNTNGLDTVIAGLPGTPTIQDISDETVDYILTVAYNASQVAESDRVAIANMVAAVINYLTEDSWCKDCCNNTFDSYKIVKTKIEELGGFTPKALSYIMQIIGMPCNYAILNPSDFIVIQKQLKTAILVDNTMAEMEKAIPLAVLAVSESALNYWIAQASSGAWNGYMITYGAGSGSVAAIRPFWLANILGALVSTRVAPVTLPGTSDALLTLQTTTGAIANASAFAVFAV